MSEEPKEQKKRIVTELKFPLPDKRTSFDSQFDIISAYVVASNNGIKSSGYKELEPYIKIDSTLVSGCNKFFQHLGLIQQEENGKYSPTELAIELYNGRKWKDDNMIKSTLRKILDNSWFWNQTRQFLEVNDTTTRSELIQKLGLTCGADPEKHTRALDKLVEYMQFSELIKEEDGKISLNASLPPQSNTRSKPTIPSKDAPSSSTQDAGDDRIISVSNLPNVTLGITITPDMSEEQIRKTIRIVLDEINKIQNEKKE